MLQTPAVTTRVVQTGCSFWASKAKGKKKSEIPSGEPWCLQIAPCNLHLQGVSVKQMARFHIWEKKWHHITSNSEKFTIPLCRNVAGWGTASYCLNLVSVLCWELWLAAGIATAARNGAQHCRELHILWHGNSAAKAIPFKWPCYFANWSELPQQQVILIESSLQKAVWPAGLALVSWGCRHQEVSARLGSVSLGQLHRRTTASSPCSDRIGV